MGQGRPARRAADAPRHHGQRGGQDGVRQTDMEERFQVTALSGQRANGLLSVFDVPIPFF